MSNPLLLSHTCPYLRHARTRGCHRRAKTSQEDSSAKKSPRRQVKKPRGAKSRRQDETRRQDNKKTDKKTRGEEDKRSQEDKSRRHKTRPMKKRTARQVKKTRQAKDRQARRAKTSQEDSSAKKSPRRQVKKQKEPSQEDKTRQEDKRSQEDKTSQEDSSAKKSPRRQVKKPRGAKSRRQDTPAPMFGIPAAKAVEKEKHSRTVLTSTLNPKPPPLPQRAFLLNIAGLQPAMFSRKARLWKASRAFGPRRLHPNRVYVVFAWWSWWWCVGGGGGGASTPPRPGSLRPGTRRGGEGGGGQPIPLTKVGSHDRTCCGGSNITFSLRSDDEIWGANVCHMRFNL